MRNAASTDGLPARDDDDTGQDGEVPTGPCLYGLSLTQACPTSVEIPPESQKHQREYYNLSNMSIMTQAK